MADLTATALVDRLRAAGCVYAEDEAALLLAAADGPALAALVARREAGEPLEQVLGWASFCGVRIPVAPGVFVPRRRTELVVRAGLEAAPFADVVVELCCGAGAVARVLAERLPAAEVHAADVDPAAVACARRNLEGRGRVHQGDLFDALPLDLVGRVDLLVANAPYVPTDEIALMPREARLSEPAVALDGGPDGVALHRRIAADAPRWLTAAGVLVVETSERQAELTAGAVRAAGRRVAVRRDDDLDATVVVGYR